jgi:threonylcarbamoyladenosine tRNA methylthiotransferase MtaB
MSYTKISFLTQGCRLNQSETAVIERQFDTDAFIVTDDADTADVVVVNTCTVTENGDADTRKLVRQLATKNKTVKVALIGCQAQILKEALLDLPNVTWVVGNAEKFNLAAIVGDASATQPQVIVPKIERDSFTVNEVAIDRKHTRANLKIQDGCDFFCAFCVIPFARGPARSRQFNDILDEAQLLVAAGYQEVVITGVNIGTYMDSGKTFLDVIDALDGIEGLKRIRISSIEPTTIPDALLDRMADPHSKVCRHLHIPLQAGTDPILKAMNRKYTLAEFDAFITKARHQVPGICIGTDVIVGFPGETDDLFEAAEAYIRDAEIDYVHVFSYSERRFARSKRMEGQVSAADKAKRSAALRSVSSRKKRLFLNSLCHHPIEVLSETQKYGYWTGLTDNYARIYFEGPSAKNQFHFVIPQEIYRDGLLSSMM